MGVKEAVWFELGMAIEHNLGDVWRLHLGAPHAVCRSVEQVLASMNFTECTSLGSSFSLLFCISGNSVSLLQVCMCRL